MESKQQYKTGRKEYDLQWYHKHKERINKKLRKRYAEDPDYRKYKQEHCKKYTDKNREVLNLKLREKEKNNESYRIERRKKHQEHYRRRKNEIKKKVFEALGNKCFICEESGFECLDIHHLDGNSPARENRYKKLHQIAKWKLYLEETSEGNIILICSNCHRKLHAGVIEV